MIKKYLTFTILLCLTATAFAVDIISRDALVKIEFEKTLYIKAHSYLSEAKSGAFLYIPPTNAKLDTLYLQKKTILVNFTEEFAYRTLRSSDVDDIYTQLLKTLSLPKKYTLNITVDKLALEQYVPAYFADKKDKTKHNKPYKGVVNVKNLSSPFRAGAGLDHRHIALWNSHGYYYNHKLDMWKWQRAPLFSTVEDLLTSAYVLPFLVPMLENAGANVYLPRERDVQSQEIIVDNLDTNFTIEGRYKIGDDLGFKSNVTLNASDINPFKEGSHLILKRNAETRWSFTISDAGDYAIYVSYVSDVKSTKKAHYTVHHSGGNTEFAINQNMGGGTWIYLDDFYFEKGETAYVSLDGGSRGVVSADAVKVGGGMGSVIREGKVSGVPRWQEAARYNLQYVGIVDTLVFNRHGDVIDYNDDFRSRARWVNYLLGDEYIEPWLTKGARVEGLNIPIDMSLGLHTDAGHFNDMDSIVGTLGIYSTYDVKKNREFFYGTSRLVNRDLMDMVQSQVVDDARALYDKDWTKRELWDKMYSEATFATVPSMLLELHAHSNPRDMRYGLDPQFRFDMSRSIYKGMLRFLASYYDEAYVVQPLAVKDFAIAQGTDAWHLTWEATVDSLEPTAVPSKYILYTRKDGRGWDNGVLVKNNFIDVALTNDAVYSFKVTAVNAGGESFPSVVLSAAHVGDDVPTVLVVDGFTRVSAPPFMLSGDSVGLATRDDEGVAWGKDIATIGQQYEYNQRLPWVSDDNAGHGASSFELSDKVFVGNNFDHSYSHVQAIALAGYNAVSVSSAAFVNGYNSTCDVVDLFFGEQRSLGDDKTFAIYTPNMIATLQDYLQSEDARLIVSGAHIASDVMDDISVRGFVTDELGYGLECRLDDSAPSFYNKDMTDTLFYNVGYNMRQYRVEHVDGLNVVHPEISDVLYSYSDELAASILFEPSYRVVSSSVPFVTISDAESRYSVMSHWLKILLKEE